MRLVTLDERIILLTLRLLQFETGSVKSGIAPDIFLDSSLEAAVLQLIHIKKAAHRVNNVIVRYHLLRVLIFYFDPSLTPRYHS